MSDKNPRHTRESFRALLVNGYDCKYLGSFSYYIPSPYDSPEDGPDYFQPPDGGEAFMVPLVFGDEGFYPPSVIENVIANNRLNFRQPAMVEKKEAANE